MLNAHERGGIVRHGAIPRMRSDGFQGGLGAGAHRPLTRSPSWVIVDRPYIPGSCKPAVRSSIRVRMVSVDVR